MKRLTSVISVILALTSCTHKELCYDHPHTLEIDVEFDWSKAPDAKPGSMSLYLFEEEAEEGNRYEFTDHTKGKIRVMPGKYQAVCINSDTRSISFADRSRYETSLIVTKDADMQPNLTPLSIRPVKGMMKSDIENERLAMSPDSVWTARMEEVIADSLCRKLTFTPEEAFSTIKVEIKNVENIKYLSTAVGSLSSFSEGFHIGLNKLSDEKVTIPFELDISKGDKRLSGELRVFGHCPNGNNKHILTVYGKMADGNTYSQAYDVTGQIHESETDIISILLETLALPEPTPGSGGGGGGFQPSVGDWESVDIGIKM